MIRLKYGLPPKKPKPNAGVPYKSSTAAAPVRAPILRKNPTATGPSTERMWEIFEEVDRDPDVLHYEKNPPDPDDMDALMRIADLAARDMRAGKDHSFCVEKGERLLLTCGMETGTTLESSLMISAQIGGDTVTQDKMERRLADRIARLKAAGMRVQP